MKYVLALLFVMIANPALAYQCKNAKIIFDKHDQNAYYYFLDNTIHADADWLNNFPLSAKKFVLAHECGHAMLGRSEQKADSYAIKWGKKEGWLDIKGIDAWCEDIHYDPDDGVHGSGINRCKRIRKEFYKH